MTRLEDLERTKGLASLKLPDAGEFVPLALIPFGQDPAKIIQGEIARRIEGGEFKVFPGANAIAFATDGNEYPLVDVNVIGVKRGTYRHKENTLPQSDKDPYSIDWLRAGIKW